MREVILIRHAEVELRWKGICYGAMDVSLSQAGIEASRSLVARWAIRPQCVVHSGLKRTKTLAEMFVDRFPSLPVFEDHRLRERNYGDWEGRTWDEVFASDPDHFHDLIDQPSTYRPPAGETTSEMLERLSHWYRELTEQEDLRSIVAISHSGPIAALCGSLLGLPANQCCPWTIANLESIRIDVSLAETDGGRLVRHDSSGRAGEVIALDESPVLGKSKIDSHVSISPPSLARL